MAKATSLKNKEQKLEIVQNGNQLWTTSLDIAEKFGKRHDDVLKAIRNLECSDGFRLRHFAESSYQVECQVKSIQEC